MDKIIHVSFHKEENNNSKDNEKDSIGTIVGKIKNALDVIDQVFIGEDRISGSDLGKEWLTKRLSYINRRELETILSGKQSLERGINRMLVAIGQALDNVVPPQRRYQIKWQQQKRMVLEWLYDVIETAIRDIKNQSSFGRR